MEEDVIFIDHSVEESIQMEFISHFIPEQSLVFKEKPIPIATIHHVQEFQNASETQNKQFIQNMEMSNEEQKASLANNQKENINFVYQNGKEYMVTNGVAGQISSILTTERNKTMIRIDLPNFYSQNVLSLRLQNLSKGKNLTLSSQVEDKTVKYTYELSLNNMIVTLKTIITLTKEERVWKSIDIPLRENKVHLKVHELNHRETIIQINQFQFSLLLNCPIQLAARYHFQNHSPSMKINKLELQRNVSGLNNTEEELYCANQCQII